MELRRRAEEGREQFKRVRRGWCLGDKAFRKELLGQTQEQMKEHHFGEEWVETEQEEAKE